MWSWMSRGKDGTRERRANKRKVTNRRPWSFSQSVSYFLRISGVFSILHLLSLHSLLCVLINCSRQNWELEAGDEITCFHPILPWFWSALSLFPLRFLKSRSLSDWLSYYWHGIMIKSNTRRVHLRFQNQACCLKKIARGKFRDKTHSWVLSFSVIRWKSIICWKIELEHGFENVSWTCTTKALLEQSQFQGFLLCRHLIILSYRCVTKSIPHPLHREMSWGLDDFIKHPYNVFFSIIGDI